MPEKPEKIMRVQAMRGIAAISVVLCHYASVISLYHPAAAWLNTSKYGPAGVLGVDIFFVLSGFIMAHNTQYKAAGKATALEFLFHRVVRIYPLYWFWSFMLLLIWVCGIGLQQQHPSFGFLMRSFSLFPAMQPDGKWEPWLGPGWTLTFEMYFYLAFAAALTFAPIRFRSATVCV